jgi:hypothetical protein
MSTFKPLLREKQFTPIAAAPTYSSLRPSNSLAPRPASNREQAHPVTQAQLDHAARFGHSFESISLFPPKKKNTTGLPDHLKAGVENLSGMAMDDVRVHYNSSKPAQLQALAYTQGAEIHVSPGQEKHLPHEAWHVVQQKQGRVRPTLQAKGVAINDEAGLEQEATFMGATAIQRKCAECEEEEKQVSHQSGMSLGSAAPVQLALGDSCYCPGWTTLGPYQKEPEDIVPVGEGLTFTSTQAAYILTLNAKKSTSGSITVKPQSYYDSDTTVLAHKGALVTKDELTRTLAEVDHIVPKEKGGCNSVKNAQVISAYENGTIKGTTYPYGGYTGRSVYDPTANVWHMDKATAIKQGATNAKFLP